MNTSKPLVTYRPASLSLYYFMGHLHASLIPEDHPDTAMVVNGEYAHTSTIIAYDVDAGTFETKNTRYIPAEPRTLQLPEVPAV